VLFADPIFGEAISKRVVEQIIAQCGQKCGHAFFFEFWCGSKGSRYSGTVTCWRRDSSERASRCVVSCYALTRALVYASFLSTPPSLVHPAIVDSYCCSNAVLTRRPPDVPPCTLCVLLSRRPPVTGIGADPRRAVGRASSDLRLVVLFGPCGEPAWCVHMTPVPLQHCNLQRCIIATFQMGQWCARPAPGTGPVRRLARPRCNRRHGVGWCGVVCSLAVCCSMRLFREGNGHPKRRYARVQSRLAIPGGAPLFPTSAPRLRAHNRASRTACLRCTAGPPEDTIDDNMQRTPARRPPLPEPPVQSSRRRRCRNRRPIRARR
jgi:hypothetical protein